MECYPERELVAVAMRPVENVFGEWETRILPCMTIGGNTIICVGVVVSGKLK